MLSAVIHYTTEEQPARESLSEPMQALRDLKWQISNLKFKS
jgi:hypothetical protein